MKKVQMICTDRKGRTASFSRRRFLRHSAVAAIAVSGLGATGGRSVLAQASAEKVSESDPVAQTFGYVHNTENADKTKFARHDVSQMCKGCALYQDKEEGWGACGIFPGKRVSATGWCNAWVQKPGS